MNINIITIFPEFYKSFLNTSIIKKAIDNNIISINLVDLKKFGEGKFKKVDDTPYGGGPGMVIKVNVVDKALNSINTTGYKIALTPKGNLFSQKKAKKLSLEKEITLVCGRYEGFDERVFSLVDEKISMGKYVTMGGESPSLCLIESIVRLIPGVIGKNESTIQESYSESFNKEYPNYTKPKTYNNTSVPEILLSGNHKKIEEWRKNNAK